MSSSQAKIVAGEARRRQEKVIFRKEFFMVPKERRQLRAEDPILGTACLCRKCAGPSGSRFGAIPPERKPIRKLGRDWPSSDLEWASGERNSVTSTTASRIEL